MTATTATTFARSGGFARSISCLDSYKECAILSKEYTTSLAVGGTNTKAVSDFEKLTSFENLFSSYQVARKGKGKKRSAQRFSVLALENLVVMKRQLEERTYRVGAYTAFVVSEPKRRIVKSGTFRDKVLQHCLCDCVLLPRLQSCFVLDNYAGQAGKGTLFGLDRLSENLLDFYAKHGSGGYILKCDITKFFYSIDHDLMKACVRRYFDDDGIRWICNLLIDSTDGLGLPLGNQCSQVFALMFLDGLDHYVTEDLGCVWYGRYADDFYLLSDDKNYLKDCKKKIEAYLSELRLTLNSKTEIVPMRKGVRFLGFHSYLTEDGKVIRRLTGDNKRQIKKRLRKDAKLVLSGKMTREKFDEKYNSWKNHASHGNCYKLTTDMDRFVDNLFP